MQFNYFRPVLFGLLNAYVLNRYPVPPLCFSLESCTAEQKQHRTHSVVATCDGRKAILLETTSMFYISLLFVKKSMNCFVFVTTMSAMCECLGTLGQLTEASTILPFVLSSCRRLYSIQYHLFCTL